MSGLEKYLAMSDEEMKKYFASKIESDPKWARRALLAIYDQQTEEERRWPDQPHVSDGKGFSEKDQSFLSNIAYQALHGVTLSAKQMEWVQKLMPRYAGQLVKIVRAKTPPPERAYLFDSFYVNSATKHLSSTLKELYLSEYPNAFTVSSPSGNMVMRFELRELHSSHDELSVEIPAATYQATGRENEGWTCTLLFDLDPVETDESFDNWFLFA